MRRFSLHLAVALAVALMFTAATFASTPNFTPPTGFDAAALTTEAFVNNKTLILSGIGAAAFIAVIVAIRRTLTKGAGRITKG